jgi:YgiT-type zinc finger domain-containing protein
MKCVICKNGETQKGFATVTLEREGATIIIKGVPADVCENCGEYYLSDEATTRVMDLSDKAIRNGAEIEIMRYAA